MSSDHLTDAPARGGGLFEESNPWANEQPRPFASIPVCGEPRCVCPNEPDIPWVPMRRCLIPKSSAGSESAGSVPAAARPPTPSSGSMQRLNDPSGHPQQPDGRMSRPPRKLQQRLGLPAGERVDRVGRNPRESVRFVAHTELGVQGLDEESDVEMEMGGAGSGSRAGVNAAAPFALRARHRVPSVRPRTPNRLKINWICPDWWCEDERWLTGLISWVTIDRVICFQGRI